MECDDSVECFTALSNLELTTSASKTLPKQIEVIANTEKQNSADEELRNMHIPYILNGELYEIRSQAGENVTVKCCHCPPDRVYRGSVRSTGNFHMHIKRRHPYLLGKLHNMKVNALLERRERFLKNRKASSSRRRNSSATNVTSGDGASILKHELRPLSTPSPSQPLIQQQQQPGMSLMHTHKLKIKQAFQRHQQMQQLQQHEEYQQQLTQNSNLSTVVSLPAEGTDSTTAPINYSTRSTNLRQGQEKLRELSKDIEMANVHDTNKSDICFTGVYLKNQQGKLESRNSSSLQHLLGGEPSSLETNSELTTYEDLATLITAENTPSSSSLSSCCVQKSDSVVNDSCNSSTVIKNEIPHFDKAIDLSIQGSVGSLSSSGIGSLTGLQSAGALTGQIHFVPKSFDTNDQGTFLQWQQIFTRSLHDLQNELRARNQIETNRILLDIAKFKYLHPNFNYHY